MSDKPESREEQEPPPPPQPLTDKDVYTTPPNISGQMTHRVVPPTAEELPPEPATEPPPEEKPPPGSEGPPLGGTGEELVPDNTLPPEEEPQGRGKGGRR